MKGILPQIWLQRKASRPTKNDLHFLGRLNASLTNLYPLNVIGVKNYDHKKHISHEQLKE